MPGAAVVPDGWRSSGDARRSSGDTIPNFSDLGMVSPELPSVGTAVMSARSSNRSSVNLRVLCRMLWSLWEKVCPAVQILRLTNSCGISRLSPIAVRQFWVGALSRSPLRSL
jgi:hypothetical protein